MSPPPDLFPFPPEYWEALGASRGIPATANEIEKVTRATSQDAARWAFSQWRLRERAKQKFNLAEQMLFDRDGLEMASHQRVAEFHASLFDPEKTTADACCGIGSDLIALARAGEAVGFESDPERARIARWNLNVCSVAAEVTVENSLEAIHEYEQVFCDPSRRRDGARLAEVEQFAPNPFEVLSRARVGAKVAFKLSPMLPDGNLTRLGETVLFVSYRRECREALCLRGFDQQKGIRALHLESGETIAGESTPPVTEQPSTYIFDIDPAAIRAGAAGTLCSAYGLSALGYAGGYLTGPDAVDSSWLAPFEFMAAYPFSPAQPLKLIRELPAGEYDFVAVKSRIPGLDNSRLTQLLRNRGRKGAQPAVVLLYAAGRSGRALLCRPYGL